MSFLSQPLRLVDLTGGVVQDGVVAGLVAPAGPDHAQPGAGQDAQGVAMAFAASSCVVVDRRGPVMKANAAHPTYQAMIELGRAQKTIFLARYLRSREPRFERSCPFPV